MIRRHVVDDNGAHVKAIVVCFSAGTRVSQAVAAQPLNWRTQVEKENTREYRENKNDLIQIQGKREERICIHF